MIKIWYDYPEFVIKILHFSYQHILTSKKFQSTNVVYIDYQHTADDQIIVMQLISIAIYADPQRDESN